MENLIQVKKAAKSYGSKTLFEEASFSINEGEHVGVIGPNGAGKTTLFRVLAEGETLDSGDVIRSRNLRLGYLAQHDEWEDGETVESFIERGATLPPWELRSLGRALGLEEKHYISALSSLSGGYRMRAKLLRLIGTEPNLMLLDEPTNYLDLETLLVLEKFLQGFQGAFLVISHDREFLRRTTTHTLEVESGDVVKYAGNIDDYFEQKELLRNQLEARALSLAEKRAQVLDFVARFGAKATKASQAQSRLKSLDRMESIEVKPIPVSARIRIPPPSRVGRNILRLEGASFGYDERTILSGIDIRVNGGEHLAVVGLNGAGKSTLLKGLAGRLAPLQGERELGYEATISFFNQFVAEELDPNETVLEALSRKAHPEVLPQEVKDLAGSLLFSGDAAHKPIRVLSGGERSRVALGQVLLAKASCLILDEPTNHLDFQTVEALTEALRSFEGAIVCVSHDRGFIRRIGTKILEISAGSANLYPGTYDEYVWSMEKGAFHSLAKGASVDRSVSRSSNTESDSPSEGSAYRENKKRIEKRLRQLDSLITALDREIPGLNSKIAELNEALLSGSGNSVAIIKEMGDAQGSLNSAEERWLAAFEEKEALEVEMETLVKGRK